jgi:phosphohistidine phosphatase SixA
MLSASPRARADQSAAWSALGAGGHVALVRHAEAPGAPGDPAGFKLSDCATQRNLSAKGRRDAAALGARLRSKGVGVGAVLSSPWCRCIDTAKLMDVGTVTIEPTFANAFVLSDRRAALTDGARKVVSAWDGPGTLVVVTHGSNILALTGVNPGEGETVVVAPGRGGPPRVVGRIAAGTP